MTYIVLALVWLTATGAPQRAEIALSQPTYVSASDCSRAAHQLYHSAVTQGVIPPRSPSSFRFSCTTAI